MVEGVTFEGIVGGVDMEMSFAVGHADEFENRNQVASCGLGKATERLVN